MKMINQIIHLTFFTYTLMIAVRIIASWVPEFVTQPWMLFLAQFTDPYLNLFRRIIPPIGGVLDVSPILAFIGLHFAESFLKMIFRSC